jgi:hypothetical protein
MHHVNLSPDRTITDKAVSKRHHIITGGPARGINHNEFVSNRFRDITKAFKTPVKTGEIMPALISTLYDPGIYIVLHNHIPQVYFMCFDVYLFTGDHKLAPVISDR